MSVLKEWSEKWLITFIYEKTVSMYFTYARSDAKPNFYFGNTLLSCSMLHSRLRHSCCSLNGDLFRVNIIDDPVCSCGSPCKTAFNYFFHCPKYSDQRIILFASLASLNIYRVSLEILLYGDVLSSDTINSHIFSYVQFPD
ncbi:hypothetical protein KUTeg_006604, partial [Tegillarca granosa]